MEADGLVVVTGATGRQGGAVVRHLLSGGRRVRALTRSPTTPAAGALAALGAQVVGADMADPGSLDQAFAGAAAVFSVQPYHPRSDPGPALGRNVAEAADRAGVAHLVQASTGTGSTGTGVPSWDGKARVAEHTREIGMPLTVVRAAALMELMTDRDFFPAMSTWSVMPKAMGEDRPLPWICADDVGAAAAAVLAAPDRYVGADLMLAAEVRSIGSCRSAWRSATGRRPRRVPVPVALFERMVGADLVSMWRWLATGDVQPDLELTRTLVPAASTVEAFLERRVGARRAGVGPT